MNLWDSLLAWLAHKSDNKWANVKAATRRLSLLDSRERERSPLGHAMYWVGPLIQLGHVEYDPDGKTIAALSAGIVRDTVSSRAVLYGYWDPRLVTKLRQIGVKRYIHHPLKGPTCWAIREDSLTTSQLAADLDVWLVEGSNATHLELLPPISSLLQTLNRDHSPLDGAWERFFGGKWRAWTSPLSDIGLYRRSSGQVIKVLVKSDLRSYRIETLDQELAAKWDLSPNQGWQLDHQNSRLLIPHGAPPLPTIVSRGLTVFSGRLPVHVSCSDGRWLSYTGVNAGQASEAARVMEQVLTTRNQIDE